MTEAAHGDATTLRGLVDYALELGIETHRMVDFAVKHYRIPKDVALIVIISVLVN